MAARLPSCATCNPITVPNARITPSATNTASSTAGTRHKPRRRIHPTTGANTKLSSTASVIGISTSRAKYSPLITTTPTASIISPFVVGVSAATTRLLVTRADAICLSLLPAMHRHP